MRAGLILLIAGILDAVFTQLGVTFGIVDEANPAVKVVMEKSWMLFYLLKISLPLLLIGIIIYRPLMGWVKGLIRVSCAVYLSVLAIHFSWIFFYLSSIG